ncbi:hypothetical protein ACUN0G_32605 [Pseudomonas sp. 32A]|uniref:hypothetical protein n=1 Tax=Pseudomonas sp. 32A TaxID=651185 RepID=UPI0040454426
MHDTILRDTTVFRVWRLCAWAGPVYLVGLVAFWGLLAGFLPAPPQYLNAQQISEFFLANNLKIRAGMVGTLFVAPLYYVWSLVISAVIKKIEGPDGLLAQLEFVGGIATAFVTLGFSIMWLTASVRTSLRSPQDIQLLSDIGWFIFDTTIMVTAIQMCAFGGAIFMDRRTQPLLPKWLGWATFAIAATFIAAYIMPFVEDGPFAWHGLITYWVVLSSFFAWMVLTSILLFPAIRQVEQESLA